MDTPTGYDLALVGHDFPYRRPLSGGSGRRVYPIFSTRPFERSPILLSLLSGFGPAGVVLVRDLGRPLPAWTAEALLVLWHRGYRHADLFFMGTGHQEAGERESRLLLAHAGFPADDLPIVRGDPLLPDGLAELLAACDATFPDVGGREGAFFLSLDDVFHINGKRTVVTGQVLRGSCAVGDRAEVVRHAAVPFLTVITNIERFMASSRRAVAGENVGLMLRGVVPGTLDAGLAVARPGSVTPVSGFEAVVFLSDAEGGAGMADGDAGTVRLRHVDLPARVHGLQPLAAGSGPLGVCAAGGLTRCRVDLTAEGVPALTGTAFRLGTSAGGRGVGVVIAVD
jgi:hypothetical protein